MWLLAPNNGKNTNITPSPKEVALSQNNKVKTISVLKLKGKPIKITNLPAVWKEMSRRVKFKLNPETELKRLEKEFREMKEIIRKRERIPTLEKAFRKILTPQIWVEETNAMREELEKHATLCIITCKGAQNAWEKYEENYKSRKARFEFMKYFRLTGFYMKNLKEFLNAYKHYFEGFETENALTLNTAQSTFIELSTDV